MSHKLGTFFGTIFRDWIESRPRAPDHHHMQTKWSTWYWTNAHPSRDGSKGRNPCLLLLFHEYTACDLEEAASASAVSTLPELREGGGESIYIILNKRLGRSEVVCCSSYLVLLATRWSNADSVLYSEFPGARLAHCMSSFLGCNSFHNVICSFDWRIDPIEITFVHLTLIRDFSLTRINSSSIGDKIIFEWMKLVDNVTLKGPQ